MGYSPAFLAEPVLLAGVILGRVATHVGLQHSGEPEIWF